MKKALSLIQFLLITFSIFSQGNLMIDRKLPHAGAFNQDEQCSFGLENKKLFRESGYNSLNMSFQGNWALGTPKDVVSSITGDTIFIVAGGGVIILNISNPASPQIISEVYARAMVDFMYYDYITKQLYLAAYFSGFEIWDLSDISDPVRLSRTPTEELPRGGIYAYGGYLYVITYADGMLVYDITDPAHPQYSTTINISGFTGGYFAEDNFLYVVTNNAIRLFDLSVPSVPVPRDYYPCTPKGVQVNDGYGYIADQSGLIIIDASNPDDLSLVGSLAIPGACYDVAVIDDYAYVANNWYGGTEGGVYAIDVSDLTNPIQSDFYNSYFTAISGVSNYIICTNNEGYSIFNVTTPGQLEFVQQTGLPGSVLDVAIKENYAITASNGIRVFDVTNKSKPEQLAFMESSANLVNISGDLAVCTPQNMAGGNRLSILNVSDPTNLVELGHYNNIMLPQEAIIHGDYVYIAGWWDGVTILNISDPSNPSFVNKVLHWTNGAIPGEEFCYASDISVQGNYLYIIDYKPFEAEDSKGLFIYDISDPENPVFVSRYIQQSEIGWRIMVKENYAYIADGDGGVEVIDISVPLSPETVAYLPLMDVAYNLDISHDYVYVSCYILGGVQAIDISTPKNPSLTGYYYQSGMFALNVTADGHDIYIADASAGFQIYRHDVSFVGIEDIASTNNDVAVFPNPTDGILKLDLESAKEILLFDDVGRFIKQINITSASNKIDLSNHPNGIYYLKFKIDGQIIVKKIVLIN